MRREVLAFPRPMTVDKEFNKVYPAQRGMKLRDYFAAKALNGLLASGAYKKQSADDITHEAYKIADAMMYERQESHSQG